MTTIPLEDFTVAAPALDLNLPDEFWHARPLYGHIRQAARSRLVSPDAVLAAVLTRVAAITSHTVEIPPIVGSPCGLTYYAVLVGPPESGKSAAAKVAAELLPAPPEVLDLLPPGSGEGLVECLFEVIEDQGDKGKPVKVKRQTKHAAIFHVDEGETLADLGNRSGSTLLATLRSAWTNATLGNTNASADRRRILGGETYVYGATVGIQPELAGPLLDGASAGTPQRFTWLLATEAGAPDHDENWPGLLPWEPIDLDKFARHHGRNGTARHPLIIHRSVVEDVREHRRGTLKGDVHVESLDSHRMLLRLKTAALLALLDRRHNVTDDDWHLAGIIGATSKAVRRSVEAALLQVQTNKETAAADRTARREIHVEGTKAEKALTSAARSVARAVGRHEERGQHKDQGGGCTRRCVSQAIASKHRELVAVDDVIDEAERNGWIAVSADRWLPGESRPA